MKKIFAGIDPYIHHSKPDVFIVDYPSMITSRPKTTKEEEERYNEYMKILKKTLWSSLQKKPIHEIRKEKIDKIINSIYDESPISY